MKRTIPLANGLLSYEIKRTKVRGIRLLMDGSGMLRVHANPRYSLETIEAFIHSKEHWILKQQQRPALIIQDSTSELLWRGVRYPLVVKQATTNELVIQPDCAELYCRRSDEDYVKRVLLQIKKEQTARVAEMLRSEVEAISGIRHVTYTYRNMRTRFGSCCPSKRRITLNTQLICLPLTVIRHVLYHEYAHFYHMNHSSDFHSLLESWDPDANEAKKILKSVSFL